jgi:Fe2+ transport system protein B
MNTKIIMTASVIALGMAGIALIFIPGEIARYFDLEDSKSLILIGQILGALYFGFAMLNWMTRTSIIGGIYNKPIAVANFIHFFIAGLALVKAVMANPGLPALVWVVTIVYALFAICFGIIFYRRPAGKSKP